MNLEQIKNEMQRLYELKRLFDFVDGCYWASSMENERSFEMIREKLSEIILLTDEVSMVNDNHESLDKPIKSLSLTMRTENCLISENILTISQLLSYTYSDLLKAPNMGKKSANEIVKSLNTIGLKLMESF